MDDNLLENCIHGPPIKSLKELFQTGALFTRNSRRKALPFFCYGRSIKRPILMATSTAGSAETIRNGQAKLMLP